jgi:hypothetical protein
MCRKNVIRACSCSTIKKPFNWLDQEVFFILPRWHTDLSEITDKGIMDLSCGLSKLSKLDQLTLALYG